MSVFDDLKATAGQVLKKVVDTVGEAKDRLGLEYQIRSVRTGVPLLSWLLEPLAAAGFRRAILALGWQSALTGAFVAGAR